MPHRDPDEARSYERERHLRRTEERRAQGLCMKCGNRRPAASRKVCKSCREKGRAAERARYAKGKAEGRPYGGRNPEHRRRMARERNRRRRRERRDAGLCTHCGESPTTCGGAVCGTCARRGAQPSGDSTPPGGPRACAAGAG